MDKNNSTSIWIRVSTEDQAKSESPEHHEKSAWAYAESKDWEVKEVYHLEAVSSKSVIGHPETKRMLHDIRIGYIRPSFSPSWPIWHATQGNCWNFPIYSGNIMPI